MPLKSTPYEYPLSELEKQRQREDVENELNASEQPRATSTGKQYHERKDDWIKKIIPFLDRDKEINPEIERRHQMESLRSHPWLVFMIVAIVTSLIMFMMIPVIENFYADESTNNALQNLKEFISFVAPIIIVVSAIAGTAGYFRLFYSSWLMVLGITAGFILFIATLQTSKQSLNLGVYWIILISFAGGALGFLMQTIFLFKKKIHRELIPLLFIAFAAFIAGAFVIFEYTSGKAVDFITYSQAAEELKFQVYEPIYLPDKLAGIQPKMFVDQNTFSVYYGEDHYPPPPIIDFLSGIEIIQSPKVEELNTLDPEPGVVFVEIEGDIARFAQRRGRSTIEWNKGLTHVLINMYSNLSASEMFRIARALEPALTTE